MAETLYIKRTAATDADFRLLIAQLDHELWNELKEDQATYDQYNKVPGIKTAVIVYVNEQPVACGCFKQFDSRSVEIKRMFVQKAFRGRGLSKKVLNALEQWALEYNYQYAVLETSVRFVTARSLYESNGYSIIPNYPPYAGLEESVCMKKELKPLNV
jgi:putative acetyltransferase